MTPSRNDTLFDQARAVIPGGVNSPVRAFGKVGGTPPFIESASGATLRDADGREYLDFVGSWGPMLLGHAHPAVIGAVVEAAQRGTSFGAPTEREVGLARRVVEMVPSIEKVRFVNSGTEATMSALRVARAATGRSCMLKYRGGYHGHADAFLVEAGSGAATLGVPDSPGVTPGTAADTRTAEYNDLDDTRRLLDDGRVACVFVEPVAGNMGCVPPAPGFLEGLRELCDATGTLLVFDEVMTGFRVAPGGAQERFGVRPDLTTLGKIVGGGLPVGAFGGRTDLMDLVAPAGPVYQAGTLSGNPLASAAGNAALAFIAEHPELYTHLEALGAQLDDGIARIRGTHGYPLTWNRVGSMASLFLTEGPVTDWPSASAGEAERFTRFFHGMLAEGIYLAPSPYEAWFLSLAHTESHMDRLLTALERTLATVFGASA
ncbi:glutamate-1-semialdehyde 2,1-aminomutase [Gemmatimonadota bacterium Y43]|uniref:glutamate-1-semialdehyde 2,1-aminomutase n=1 Tax=Gaopeijia maritima TaxID=3119007 RepID=UPI00328DDD32